MTQQLFDQAMALARDGRLADAETLFAKVTAADSRNFLAHRMTALMRYQQGRFGAALEAIEAAVAVRPDVAEPWVLRGVILQRLGRSEEAIASAARATELDPRDAQAWYNRGVLLSDLGRFAEALESYDKAADIRPSPDLWANRAGALASLKRSEEAVASCDKALATWPGYIPALCNRGMALADLGRLTEAVADFDQALAQAPTLAEAWVNRGTVLYELRRLDEALASHDRALQLQADNRSAWINRGDALAGLKRYGEALEAYDRALELASGAAALVKRAAVLHVLNRLPEALAAAEDALRLRADFAEAHEIRGRVLLEMHRVEEGLEALRRSGENAQPQGNIDFLHRHDLEQHAYLLSRGTNPLGERLAGAAVNPDNAAAVARSWVSQRPQVVVIDNFLTPEGLEALRRFCWGKQMWKRPYPGGYLGALPQNGFAAPLLAQIAEELRAVFPTVIGDHALRLLWGFKYDSTLKGIAIHADQAAVNVNFWITPDDANLEPERGGLVVWDVSAPLDWDPEVYNRDEDRIRAFLKESGAKAVSIPYRANRAVIFDSDLFHETDTFTFKEGYLNRRINLTMLYGRRNSYGT